MITDHYLWTGGKRVMSCLYSENYGRKIRVESRKKKEERRYSKFSTFFYILLSTFYILLSIYSYEVYAIEDMEIHSLKFEKATLTGDAFIIEIRGTQSIDYKTMFLVANENNMERFYIDISNSKNRINVDNIYVTTENQEQPTPLAQILEDSSFPINKLVIAQNSLIPPITRVVFHLREKITPTVTANSEILKITIPVKKIESGEFKVESEEKAESRELSVDSKEKVESGELRVESKEEVEEKELNVESQESLSLNTQPSVSSPQPSSISSLRPCIVEAIKPIFLPKTTRIELISDNQLKIKQARLLKSSVLQIEIFNATTSLPRNITIDKGVIRGIAFQESNGDLSILISLTEPMLYELESVERGIVVTFQNPLLEQLVSINVNEEPISSVLLMLFTQYGANIVAGSKISGKVTARLIDVPLKAALDEILKAEGYGYIEEGGLIRVVTDSEIKAKEENKVKAEIAKPMEVLSKSFNLNHAKAANIKSLIQSIIGSEFNVLTDDRTNTLILVSSTTKEIFDQRTNKVEELLRQLDVEVPEEITSQAVAVAQYQEPKVEVVKRIFRLNYMDPEKAKTILTPLLSDKGILESVLMKKETQSGSSGAGGTSSGGGGSSEGKLDEAVDQGGYIVIVDIQEVLDKIAEEIAILDKPTPQVEIEAFIVEGSLSNNKELGVDWASINKKDELSMSFSGNQGLVIAKGIIPIDRFTGILNVIYNNNKLKVISNPTITTLEGQPAMFHSGDRIPYSRTYIQDGIQQIDTIFEEVGIVLAATPYVKDKDIVSLVLSTSVSSESGFTPAGQPRISTRTTRNQVLVRSGDTVVIAGLNSEKDSNTVSKVPLIGDIPILGKIFTTESLVKQRSEVTIFITPRIVRMEVLNNE